MKTFKKTALVATIISILLAASGCGKKSDGSDGQVVGAPGAPGIVSGIVQGLPNGGAAISFIGSNIYSSGVTVSGGAVTGESKCTTMYCYCDYTSQGAFACWTFDNAWESGGAGTVSIGGGLAYGQTGTIIGASKFEPGSGITLSLSQGSDYLHSIASGVITLSPQYVQYNFPGGLPSVIGLAFDLMISGGQAAGGGVLIYTSADSSGYHGRLLVL